jgi:hypothetical protein
MLRLLQDRRSLHSHCLSLGHAVKQSRGEQGPQIKESKCSGCGIELAGGTAAERCSTSPTFFLWKFALHHLL